MSAGDALYIHRDGETFGPFDPATIRAGLRDGTWRAEDLWWNEAAGAWAPLEDLPGEDPATARESAAISATQSGLKDLQRPAAGPLANGTAAAELADAWPLVVDAMGEIADAPGSSFVCEGCGQVHGQALIGYAREAYLCPACLKTGASHRSASVVETRNPLATLLLKHAGVWALLLVLVPFLGFKVLANMLDPYKSLPPSVPVLRQAVRILEKDAVLKGMPWAHSIRQTLLGVASDAATRAFPEAGETEKDLAHLAVLLSLEAAGRDSDAAAWIADHETIGPFQRDEEQTRKFHFVEARILARAGRFDLLEPRIEKIRPAPALRPGEMPFGIVAPPTITSPLFSSHKVYDLELAKPLFALIECDDAILAAFLRDLPPEASIGLAMIATRGMPMMPWGEMPPPTNPGGGEVGWLREQFERAKRDGTELVARIESWRGQHGANLARNATPDEAAIGRAVEAGLKAAAPGARTVNLQSSSRGAEGLELRVQLETPRATEVATAIRALTASTIPAYVSLFEVTAIRHESRGQGRWSVSATCRVPRSAASSTDPRRRFDAEFSAPFDSAPEAAQARVTTARMLVDELRRELNALERSVPRSVETALGPSARILDALMGSSGTITMLRLSSHGLVVNGIEPGTAALEALKTRLASWASERSLAPSVRTSRTSRDGREMTDWTLEYEASSR